MPAVSEHVDRPHTPGSDRASPDAIALTPRRLFQLRVILRTSLWALPTLIVLVAIAAAVALLALDGFAGARLSARWSMVPEISADGARSILGAIAGSMITVAGVVFSITVVVLALAASQYTSRVLGNFLRDRMTQTVLGTFVAVFAYCIVVLSQVHGEDDGSAFVPALSVLGGIVLAFVAIAFLIYFIHHTSVSIQVSHILARISRETIGVIEALHCEPDVPDATGMHCEVPPAGTWHPIPACANGYLQTIDVDALEALAGAERTVLRMERGVGEFVVRGSAVFATLAPLSEERGRRIDELYVLGRQRTIEQDPLYGVQQIVDIALRALSPGVNDTTTAVMCVDHLTAILACWIGRASSLSPRCPDGQLRVLVRAEGFEEAFDSALTPIRQSAEGSTAMLGSLMRALGALTPLTRSESRRARLRRELHALARLARSSDAEPADLAEIEFAASTLRSQLHE